MYGALKSLKSLEDRPFIQVIDIGCHLSKAIANCWDDLMFHYLVTYQSDEIEPVYLKNLLDWVVTDCHRGFQMCEFEGHHPGGQSWLREPPAPFIGYDLVGHRLDHPPVNFQLASELLTLRHLVRDAAQIVKEKGYAEPALVALVEQAGRYQGDELWGLL